MEENITPIRPKWKGTMTDRERFNNQMHYKSIDRCFNMEFGYWEDNFVKWPIFYENNIKSNHDADTFFNFDKLVGISGMNWMHPGFGNKVMEETDEFKIILNNDGLLSEVPKDGHDTIPRYLKSSVETPEDWKRCKEEHFRRDDPARKLDIETLKLLHPDDRDYPLGIKCGSMIGKIRDLLTFEGLAYACFDYPDMVEDMACLRYESGAWLCNSGL